MFIYLRSKNNALHFVAIWAVDYAEKYGIQLL